MEIPNKIVSLAVKDIDIPPAGNPRRDMGQLFELSDSFDRVSQLSPIIINRIADKNILIAGERRLRAAIDANMPFIEARVFENLDAETALLMTLAENKYKPLDAIEEARSYQMLIDTCGYTTKKVAKECNVTPETVERRLKLLILPDEIQIAVKRETNRLPVHQAVEIARLKNKEQQIQAARAIAPSTGPVMTEAQAKQYIEENFKAKQPKLNIDEADPADKHPTLPGPDEKTEKVETKKSLGENLKPIPAKIGIAGKLFAVAGGVEILKATLTVAIDKDVKIISLDRIFLGNNSDLLKMIKKHQPDKKEAKSKAKTNKSEKTETETETETPESEE